MVICSYCYGATYNIPHANSPMEIIKVIPNESPIIQLQITDGKGRSPKKSGAHEKDTDIQRITISSRPNRATRMAGVRSGARLHVADGAYPVYYAISRVNGRFGKQIRSFRPEEFEKLFLINSEK